MNAFHRLHALRMENDEAGFRMEERSPRTSSSRPRRTSPRAWSLFST